MVEDCFKTILSWAKDQLAVKNTVKFYQNKAEILRDPKSQLTHEQFLTMRKSLEDLSTFSSSLVHIARTMGPNGNGT